jgi:hypothetical protein
LIITTYCLYVFFISLFFIWDIVIAINLAFHAFVNHNEPIEPLTLENMFKGQPWTPVPNPECGNS